MLNDKLTEATERSEKVKPQKKAKKEREPKSAMEQVFDNPMMRQAGRTAAGMITRSLLGALGLGGRSRRKSIF
jgi:hypothetical protein